MKTVEPQILRLYLIYMEDNVGVTGITNLTVEGIDSGGNIILPETVMTENVSFPGEYYYNWNAKNMSLLGKFVNIYYKKGSSLLDIEEFYFDLFEDMDGRAL